MKKILQLLTLLFLPTLLFGQNQTIKGTITDKQSTEPLYGARVVIVGTDPLVGVIADLNGQYRLDSYLLEVVVQKH